MKVIDRYFFREMIGPFMIGVIGFVLVMTVDLLFTMADLIINKGVPLWAVMKLLVYKLPSIMVLTFPVSTLFATAMALGRLSKDNEITALRTSGVSLFRIAVPILLLGGTVSLAAYFTNEKIVPRANFMATNIIRQIIYKTELFLKYSIPLTCFVFALIGIPFSLPSPRTGRTWGLIVTIVFMFTFYVFASVFRSLGRGGILSPLAAAFTPQLTFIVIGGILLFREGWFK